MHQCQCGEIIFGGLGEYVCNECFSTYYITECLKCKDEFMLNEPSIDSDWICDDCQTILSAENYRKEIKNKGASFTICRDPSYFTNGITDRYPISYRLVLLNIIFNIFKNSDKSDFAALKKYMNDLLVAIENKTEFQINKYPNYFQIYTFKSILSEDPKGYICNINR